eukprot:1176707-Prorocentrum_minimum.AAC.3
MEPSSQVPRPRPMVKVGFRQDLFLFEDLRCPPRIPLFSLPMGQPAAGAASHSSRNRRSRSTAAANGTFRHQWHGVCGSPGHARQTVVVASVKQKRDDATSQIYGSIGLDADIWRPSEEEGDPGRGGLQGTRPRAGRLGGPASRGLGLNVQLILQRPCRALEARHRQWPVDYVVAHHAVV